MSFKLKNRSKVKRAKQCSTRKVQKHPSTNRNHSCVLQSLWKRKEMVKKVNKKCSTTLNITKISIDLN